jgi:hypothetical protein
MMKRFYLILSFFGTLVVNAQLTQKSFRLEANGIFGTFGNSSYTGGQLGARWLISDRIGLRYNFDLLYRGNNHQHIHTPMGLVGGPILIAAGIGNALDKDSTSSSGGLGILTGILLLALPEGISFHQALGDRFEVSPYANLLGIDFIRNRTTGDNRVKYAFSLGTQVSVHLFSKLTAQAFVETRKVAGVPWGFGAGIGLGWAMGMKQED